MKSETGVQSSHTYAFYIAPKGAKPYMTSAVHMVERLVVSHVASVLWGGRTYAGMRRRTEILLCRAK